MIPALLTAAPPLPAPTVTPMAGATPVPMPSVTTDPGCAVLDLVCKAKAGVTDAVAAGAQDAVTTLAGHIEEAVGNVMASLGTAWVNVRSPQLTLSPAGVGNPSDAVGYIQGHLQFYMLGFAIAGVMVAGARMAWQQRAQVGLDLFKGLAVLILVAGGGVVLMSLATAASDGLAESILSSATAGTDFGHNLAALFQFAPGTAALLTIILGTLAIFVSLLQIMLMVARSGMLVVLAGVLPTGASVAVSGAEAGKAWLKKIAGWVVAFEAYKPAAAIVYAVAFRLTGSKAFGPDGITNIATGLVLMVLALVALAALMRLAVPAVAGLAASSGGLAVAGTAAAAAVPSGAIAIRGGWGRGGGAAPTGSTSPRGPSSGPTTPGTPGPAGGGGGAGPTGAAGTAGASGAAAPAGAAGAQGATAAAKGAGAVAGPAGAAATTVITTAAQTAAKAAKGAADTATGEA